MATVVAAIVGPATVVADQVEPDTLRADQRGVDIAEAVPVEAEVATAEVATLNMEWVLAALRNPRLHRIKVVEAVGTAD